jgi:signal transduction histidine kinase
MLILAAIPVYALICWIDIVTGEISVELLYVIPVVAVAWIGGRFSPLIVAAEAVLAWHYAEYHGASPHYEHTFTYYWNAGERMLFLTCLTLLISTWKSMGVRLESQVQQRTAALKAEVVERMRAEAEIHRLAAQLTEAEESERRRIASDVHDGLAQMLSLFKLKLEVALAEEGSEAAPRRRLQDLTRSIDDLILQARTLVFDLHPAMLDDLGLSPTVQWFCEQFARPLALEMTLQEQGEPRALPAPLRNLLYRAIKELVSNAARHGKASEVVVAIHWAERQIRVVIDDDGGGFDAVKALEPQQRRGLGLASIRQRMASMGGQMYIESAPGQGTRVILQAPLALPEAESKKDVLAAD